MRKAAWLFLLFLAAGCSRQNLEAKWCMFQAENAVTEAALMKDKHVPYEGRVEVYRRACGLFMQAYEANPAVFTIARIEEARDACWKAGEREKEEAFAAFE